MATTSPAQSKITYTSANVDMEAFHQQFDQALTDIRAELGRTYPVVIDGEELTSETPPIVDVSPIDTGVVLGRFTTATVEHVDKAIRAAAAAKKGWDRTPWTERVAILRRAAGLIRERKYRLAAIMSVEVGKNRMESIGDAEEAADLIDYYCQQMEDANGFVRAMNRITPIETNTDVLRPFGVFVCIAPFNFPLALSTGMSSAALVAGNAVIYKPAQDTPWTGWELFKVYRDAGVPSGVIHYVSGKGSVIGDPLWQHPLVDGIVLTGSKEVGMHIYREFSSRWAKPCLLELGGKNPTIVMDTADLDAAAEGIVKSTYGLQNQKCSATSRVYAHKAIAKELTALVVEKARALTIGDPTERDVYFGPVINERAVKKFEASVAQARTEGEILLGGTRLTDGRLAKGTYVAPTVASLPLTSSLFMEELFVPFLAIGVVDSLDQAIEESNKAEYGLTAGIFSGKEEEIEQFFAEIQAGVTYVNKRSGSTTGAWPGAQPFTGWKGSGSTGKGGCGPYYVAQFMREQSRTVINTKQ